MKRIAVGIFTLLFLALTMLMPFAVRENIRIQQENNETLQSLIITADLTYDLQDVWEGALPPTITVEKILPTTIKLLPFWKTITILTLQNTRIKVNTKTLIYKHITSIPDNLSPDYFIYALRRIVI